MKFDIINIEEFSGQKAQIYSIMYEGDDQTLMDHFFEENMEEHEDDIREIAKKLKVMGNDTGCKSNFFKSYEGAPGDGMVALRYKQMRLYCLRYDNTCIFLGSGRFKPPDINAYQEEPLLNSKAQEMKLIAACINKAIVEKDLKVKEDGTLEVSDYIELEI